MIVLAAFCYLVGAAVGLQLDIRMIITATIMALFGCLASGLMGWTGPAETVFDTLAVIASLQAGYGSVVILNALGMVETKELPPVRVNAPPASDNPSRR